MQKALSVREAPAATKAVAFVGIPSVCGDKYPWAAYVNKGRKLVNSRDDTPFLKVDAGGLCGKNSFTYHSHCGGRTLNHTLWGSRHFSYR